MSPVTSFGSAVLVFAAWLSACEPARPSPRPAPVPAATPALRRVPLGLCEDYPEESRSLAEARRDFELLRTNGIGVLRVSMGWDGLEPQKDHYDFAFWDAFVDMAVREYHLTLIPYVAYTPEWNSDGTAQDFWKTPPRDVDEFGELMGLLARRYHGRIASWELWNEPDNRDYWLGTPADYARLIDSGASAVHAAAPDLKVVFGGLAGGVEFLRSLFEQHDAAEQVDIVNLHAYYETWNPSPLETIPSYLDQVTGIIERQGRRQSIWLAEVGYSDYRPASTATALFDYEHTPDFQAVMLLRTLALALSHPAVSLFAWYELKDPRASDAMIGDDNNRHLGVAFADYRPKPALSALAFGSRLFANGFRAIDSEVALASAPGSHAQVRSFLTARGRLVVMAWLTNHVASGTERVVVSLPYQARGSARRFDEQGRPRGRAMTRVSERGVELTLELRAGALEVVELE